MNKEGIKAYLRELEQSTDKEWTMNRIIKAEKRTFLNILEILLSLVLIGFLIFVVWEGYANKYNIVVDCNNNVRSVNGNGIDMPIPYDEWFNQTKLENQEKLKDRFLGD